jgi:hypothetical protein
VTAFLAQYDLWIYGLLGVMAVWGMGAVLWALRRLEATPFGLEKDLARRRLNAGVLLMTLCVLAGGGLFVLNRYGARNRPEVAATPLLPVRPTVIPSPTPIQSSGPIIVDSSGCANPDATLVRPEPNERIETVYEVVGTASITNFAFYKVEISGAATSGAWVTLDVGNQPVRDGVLASFDPRAYDPGEYAFRLVVTDNMGNAAPPCVIVVTLAPAS